MQFINDKRLAWCAALSILAISANVIQLAFGLSRHGQTESTIRSAATNLPWSEYYSGLLFSENCSVQSQTLKDGLGTVVGIFPMFFAELFVLFVAIGFVFTVVVVTRNFRASRAGVIVAVSITMFLLIVDQSRYYLTSVNDLSKTFFTWSSYCIHGDWGWLFDALGYLFMYLLIAFSVTFFIAASRELKNSNLKITEAWLGQSGAFKAVEATFSWLVYFGYLFLVIWVVFSGLNPEASKLYAAQVLVIYTVIFAFYFYILFQYARIALWYEKASKDQDAAHPSPITELLAPHGTRAFQILIKLSLPVIFILSVWFEILKELPGLLGV